MVGRRDQAFCQRIDHILFDRADDLRVGKFLEVNAEQPAGLGV
jgi:hypothetical protein